MVYDPIKFEFDRSEFPRKDYSYSIYNQDGCVMSDNLPANIPKPCGKDMVMMVYVDSDHAGDTVTRRLRTRFVVFLKYAPIYWSSKKQTSCKTSSFGSELCAMKQATEYVRVVRYKIRMIEILVDEPTFFYGDNKSVLATTTMPEYTMNKKTQSITFHYVI